MLLLLPREVRAPKDGVLTRVVWLALVRRARVEAEYLASAGRDDLAAAWHAALEVAMNDRRAQVINRQRAFLDTRSVRDVQSADDWRQGDWLLAMLRVVTHSSPRSSRTA